GQGVSARRRPHRRSDRNGCAGFCRRCSRGMSGQLRDLVIRLGRPCRSRDVSLRTPGRGIGPIAMRIGTANVRDTLATPTPSTRAQAAPAPWRCYFELTKPKVVALITFTAMVGTLLASGGPSLATLAWASVG